MISRGPALALLLMVGPLALGFRGPSENRESGFQRAIVALERRHGGRLGVAVLDTGTGRRTAYRGDERFPLCSTYKALATGFVLARVDGGKESLTRRVVYGKGDLVAHAPVTERHVGSPGLTISELCEAAMVVSDNTAANLQLDSFGGPAGLTAYLRALGDRVTRLDRRETALNEARPGDPRDTTTPNAMADTLRKLLVGKALSTPSRERLRAWMLTCETGTKRLRAGVPKGWRVGDKTGTGERGATNDVAIFFPPHRAPILVTAYYVGSRESDDARSAVLAQVGRLAARL